MIYIPMMFGFIMQEFDDHKHTILGMQIFDNHKYMSFLDLKKSLSDIRSLLYAIYSAY